MFLSSKQIKEALDCLGSLHPFFGMSFLAFKESQLPVGTTMEVKFTQIADVVLERHYKASKEYAGFYNPFFTSDKSKRWVAPRYGSTSLQRITTDTFGDAFIHPKGSSIWGWKEDYIEVLAKHLHGSSIPAFYLAVWLYRQEEWSARVIPQDLIKRLFDFYHINPDEQVTLFDTAIPQLQSGWLRSTPLFPNDIIAIIGSPLGTPPEEDAALRYLEIRQVGPANLLRYEPAEHLNIITGDNSLGKTFLFENIWWALTGKWIEYPALPKSNVARHQPRIAFSVTKPSGRSVEAESEYNWERQEWKKPSRRDIAPGLAIYARYDGSYAVWDPTLAKMTEQDGNERGDSYLFLSSNQVFDGKPFINAMGKSQSLCNGLLYDWIVWQNDRRYSGHYEALVTCLKDLSPEKDEPLVIGDFTRMPGGDLRDVPTLKMPYGEVPVPLVSAGVRRIISLAYILVWAWHEHLINSRIVRQKPQQRLILMVDEVENHLHPKWQRVIVPALMDVVRHLSSEVTVQMHIATHSPLVTASVESFFDENIDDQHHLVLEDNGATIEKLPFIKHGTADLWLTSEAFGLKQARPIDAENAIEQATQLQLQGTASNDEVRQVNRLLIDALPDDDEFWPLWRYFAKQHGVRK